MANTLDRSDRVQLAVLDLASFWLNIAGSVMGFALVYHYRRVFGLSPSSIGFSVSLSTFSYFLGCMCFTPIIRSLKPRYCVSISLVGMSVLLFLFLQTRSLGLAYLYIFIYGLCNSLLWPAVEMWLSRGKEGRALSVATGSFNFSWSIGAGLSSYVGGVLVSHSTFTAMWFTIIVYLVITLFLLVMATVNPSIRATQSETVQNRQEGKTDQSTPLRFFCWINAALANAAVCMVGNTFPLYAQDVLAVNEKVTGALLLVRGFSTCAVFLLLGRTNRWRFNRPMIILIPLALSVTSFIAPLFQGKFALSWYFLSIGVLFACAYTMSMFHGISGALHRSKRAGVHETVLALGSITGVIAGGWLYQRYSFNVALSVVGAVSLVAFIGEGIGMFALGKREKKAQI